MKFFFIALVLFSTLEAGIFLGDSNTRSAGMGGAFTAIGEGADSPLHNSAGLYNGRENLRARIMTVVGDIATTGDGNSTQIPNIGFLHIEFPFLWFMTAKIGGQMNVLYDYNNSSKNISDKVLSGVFSLAIPIMPINFYGIGGKLSIGGTLQPLSPLTQQNYSYSALFNLIDTEYFDIVLGTNHNHIQQGQKVLDNYDYGAAMRLTSSLGVLSIAYDYQNEILNDSQNGLQSINSEALGVEMLGKYVSFRTGYYRTVPGSTLNIDAYSGGIDWTIYSKHRDYDNELALGMEFIYENQFIYSPNNRVHNESIGISFYGSPEMYFYFIFRTLLEGGVRALVYGLSR